MADLWLAQVTKTSGGGAFVTIPRFSASLEHGPLPALETVSPLAAGDRVIVASYGRGPEQFVILGRLA